MNPIKIETYNDLPEYGEFVLVNGVDQNMYGIRRWHVCEMNDLEDGMEFRENGHFHWLTEAGTKITDVTHWCPTPKLIDECEKSPTGKHVYRLPVDSFDVPYCKYCYKE